MRFFRAIETAGTVYLVGTALSTAFCGIAGGTIGVLNGLTDTLASKEESNPSQVKTGTSQYRENVNDIVYGLASFFYVVTESTLRGAAIGATPILYPASYIYDLYSANSGPELNSTVKKGEEDSKSDDSHDSFGPSLRGSL